MPSANVNPTDIPTQDETQHWEEEAAAYQYRAPDPGAQKGSPEYRGWGIPPSRMPPKDAVEYVICKYREDPNAGVDLFFHDHRDEYRYKPLHPKYKWGLVAAVIAHFNWFKSPAGGEWINNFFGVESVAPFYDGYTYYWVRPDTKTVHELLPPERNHLGELINDTADLRIFRQWERTVNPAVSDASPRNFEDMTAQMDLVRNPYSRRNQPWNRNVFQYVSEWLQKWFLETKADEQWPVYKRGRQSGVQWVRSAERAKDVPFYNALAMVAKYHHASYREKATGPVRAYRIEYGRGQVHWCAGNEIRIVPKLDDHRLFKKDMTDEELTQEFGCKGCRKTRSCVPYTKAESLCCHCYSEQLEGGTSMPTLDLCTMIPECKNCPDRIDSKTELINLKQRWNRA